jgi:anti-anti-sigma factor
MRTVDATLNLEGELRERELFELGEQLVRLAARGYRRVVVDLSEVSHVNFKGVRPLMMKVERVREMGGDVKLCGLTPYLQAILRASGAHGLLEWYGSEAQARASFAVHSAPRLLSG